MLFPWRRPELFSQNPVSKYEIAGVPVVSIVAAAYIVILGSAFYLWATEAAYGLNNMRSIGFIVSLYILAAVVYGGMRYYRARQGVELDQIHSEIPQE